MTETAVDVNELPDSSFAYIEPGGSKDTVGKTVPRNLRHLPFKHADGTLDAEALTKSLENVEKAALPMNTRKRVKAKLEAAKGEPSPSNVEAPPELKPCDCGDPHCSGTQYHATKMAELVEKYITHEGSKWQVHSEAGKVLGTHDSESDAKAQLAAIEANKHSKAAGTVKWPVDDSRFQGSSLVDAGEKAPNQKSVGEILKAEGGPGSRVQALFFEKDKYPTAKEVAGWINDHGFEKSKAVAVDPGFRVDQAKAGTFGTLRKIKLTAGVTASIGIPSTAIKAVQDAFFLTTTGRLAFKGEDLVKAECEPIEESEAATIYRVKIASYTLHFAEKDGTAVHLPFYGNATIEKGIFSPIYKGAEQRYTLSIVYPASQKGTPEPDFHGDVMSDVELEKSAWGFMGKGTDRIGLMHRPGTSGAGKVVESYIWRGPEWKMTDAGGKEQSVSPGDWVMGIVWEPAAWEAIKSGQITGLSLQGAARKEAF